MPHTLSPFMSRVFALVLTIIQIIVVGLSGFILNSSIEHGRALAVIEATSIYRRERDAVQEQQLIEIKRDLIDLRTRITVLESDLKRYPAKP